MNTHIASDDASEHASLAGVEAVDAPAEPRASLALPRWLTGEVALYSAFGLLALALRLMSLGTHPLDTTEASQALAAWQLVSRQPVQPVGYSPLLLVGNVLTFTLFGASDFSARLAPVAFGMIVVLAPVLFRRQLGRWGALLASLFLAISPTAVYYSRHLSSEIAVLACAVLVLASAARFLESHDLRALEGATVALALLLTTGPGAFSVLFVALSFGVVLGVSWRLGSGLLDRDRLNQAWHAIKQGPDVGQRLFLWFAATLLLVGTCFLTHFPGFQAVIDQFSLWIAQMGPTVSGMPWYHHIVLMLLYEGLILAFGLAGIVLAFARRNLFRSFLVYWMMVILYAYVLFGGKSSGDLLLALVPCALLAGLAAGRLVEWVGQLGMWEIEGLFLAISLPITGYILLQISGFGRTGQAPYLWLLGIGALLLLGLLVSFVFWAGPQTTVRCFGLAAAILLGLSAWGTMWRLNYLYAGDPREPMVSYPTHPAVRDLFGLLEELSLWRSGDKRELPIGVVALEDPVVRWYVRDFRDVRFAEDVGDNPERAIYIAPASFTAPALESRYRGEPFELRSGRFTPVLRRAEFIRWLFYREAEPPESQQVVLWARGGSGLGATATQ